MTDDVASLLKARVEHAANRGFPFVFPSPYDVQIPIRSVNEAHRSDTDKAKIDRHFRLYDLSHTFATRAVAAGADLPTLASPLGHANILMTMRYVHPAAEQKRVAMKKFEEYRAEGINSAAAGKQNLRVTTKTATMERVN